jgi:glycosyltransferase involved in cell wall biosynthesis
MRIAFLSTEFITERDFSGGLANYLLRICLSLMKLGHNPTVFVTSEKASVFSYNGIQVRQIKYRPPLPLKSVDCITFRKFTRFLWIIGSARTIAKALNRENRKSPFDIVQAASFRCTNLFVSRKIPTVVRISSFEPLLREAYEKPRGIAQRMVECVELQAIKKADGVYAPSRLLAEKIGSTLKQGIKVLEPSFVIDSDNLDWSIYDDKLKKKSYLLFFGTIGVLKGCGTIAEILESLLSSEPDLYFVFVGKTTEYCGRSMMEHIWEKAASNRQRVLHFSPLNHEALYPIIKNSKAVLLPSRIDNIPNTCLEAMYFGQIVVGTKGTSFEELIDDGVSGFLCPPDDPQSLLTVTQKALSLSSLERETMSKNAKNRIVSLSPEKIVPELIHFYKSVIEQKFSVPGGK